MLYFKDGRDFEEALFGQRSNNNLFRKIGKKEKTPFGTSIKKLIRNKSLKYPATILGHSLYFHVTRELERLRIDSRELVLTSSINTEADLRHYTDGFFFLPSFNSHLVTLDAFNISPPRLRFLRERWIDSFEGCFYSENNFQSDLFQYKKGMSEWKKNNHVFGSGIFNEVDFRQFSGCSRPENHLIVTPHDVENYSRRRSFARVVAGCFAKLAGNKRPENKAK